MARDTGPKCRICRREGMKLFLKGERCLTEKCAIERRSYPPGEHGRQKVEVFVKGPGSGRETAIRSLQAAGLEILGVKDVTPQAHNGVRPKKRRRV